MPNQRVSCVQWVPMQTEDARTKAAKYGSRRGQRKESAKGTDFSTSPSIHGHFQLFLLEAARQQASIFRKNKLTELAPTAWTSFEMVRLDDPKLKWYSPAETREWQEILVEGLPGN